MKKAAIHTLGCRVNYYESEAIGELMVKSGYTLVPFSEKADCYIINTCTVTGMSDRKSRQIIRRAKKHAENTCGKYIERENKNGFIDASVQDVYTEGQDVVVELTVYKGTARNDKNVVYNTGKAFGNFQKSLKDYPMNRLHETIPDFHNTPKRVENLMKAIKEVGVAVSDEEDLYL